MNLVIIDYGSGNLRSVENAFKNSVKTNKLNFTIKVTNELELISKADHLILPGVGSFPDCKKGLEDVKGLIKLLTNEVINNRKKFLGICVGMQLLFESSNEFNESYGLGLIKGIVQKLSDKKKEKFKSILPHMGWNKLRLGSSFKDMYFKDEPLYPFGYGLSYTNFKFQDVRLNNTHFSKNDTLSISFEITNTGSRSGSEVPQLYIENQGIKKLKAFKRVFLNGNESIEASLEVAITDLQSWDLNKNKYVVSPGDYSVHLGTSSKDLLFTENIKLLSE